MLAMNTPTTAPPLNASRTKLESPFHLKPTSFKFRKSSQSATRFYINFVYESIVDIVLTIYYAGMEVMDDNCDT
jgi:hypothetical protein